MLPFFYPLPTCSRLLGLKGKDGNMQSVLEHKAVVAEYLADELAELP